MVPAVGVIDPKAAEQVVTHTFVQFEFIFAWEDPDDKDIGGPVVPEKKP